MENKKISVFSSGLIWFGAAVSIAEIIAGTLIAPLGFFKGLTAVILGHAIGCVPLYAAGLIGAKSGRSAMDTVKISFGYGGASFFSILNIMQLIGWTAVMIIGGGRAVDIIAKGSLPLFGTGAWCLVIGALIILWTIVGITNLNKLNIFAMAGLFVLTVLLSRTIFGGGEIAASGAMSFGSAVELSAAMPLSWLPLIADYTRYGEKPKTALAVSVGVYFLTSCWMYAIGLGAVLFIGEYDIAKIMLGAGFGAAGVFIVIFSTVTTAFLDVYSAGVSFVSMIPRAKEKIVSIVVCAFGTLLAVFTPIEQYENFLFLIGSVFAPMISILIVDFFIIGKDSSKESVNITNFVLWVLGFALYRYFMAADTIIGSTLPVMAAICVMGTVFHFAKAGICSKEGA